MQSEDLWGNDCNTYNRIYGSQTEYEETDCYAQADSGVEVDIHSHGCVEIFTFEHESMYDYHSFICAIYDIGEILCGRP